MSNDMSDVIGVQRNFEYPECYDGSEEIDEGDTKYYSESNVQQLIKEAEQKQREKCADAYMQCVGAPFEISDEKMIYDAILNAGGE